MPSFARDGHFMEIHAVEIDAEGITYGSESEQDARDQLIEAVNSGGSALAALGGNAKAIAWVKTSKVRINRKNATLDFTTGRKNSSKESSLDVGKDIEFRDRVFDAIQAATGWAPKEKAHNPITAAFVPGFWLALTGFLGWYLVSIARTQASGGSTPTPSGRARILYSLADLLGPTGSVVVAGLIFVLVLLWFLKRVTNPPVFVTLKP